MPEKVPDLFSPFLRRIDEDNEMNTRIFPLLLLCWLTLGRCTDAVGQQREGDDPCKTTLPFEAGMVVEDKLKDWKVVTIADLRPDDRGIWTGKFGSTCPGVAAGHFDPGPSSSYAVTLIQRRGQDIYQMLAVLSKTGHAYRLATLSPATQTSVPSIVTKGPPGRYSTPDGSIHINSRFDVISYEVIEAGAEIYYWQNGSYHSLQTSE
jgi:hypothetical protein